MKIRLKYLFIYYVIKTNIFFHFQFQVMILQDIF
jgi:hypothetical protein